MTLLLLYLLLAVGISFLCSILEAVILSVTPSHIAMLNDRKQRSGELLSTLKQDINRPLAAILSLNTIAHTFGAAGVGAQSLVVFGNAYVSITSAIVTLLILVFSEIIPKTLGAIHWQALAGFTARTCVVLIVLTWPLVKLSQWITRLLAAGKTPPTLSREEFQAMARMGLDQGIFEQQESNIFHNLMRFNVIRVHDIMTPRVVVAKLQQDVPLADLADDIGAVPFSRLPIYAQSDEHITGYVLKNDIMLALARGEDQRALHELKREVAFVPEFISLQDLFTQLLHEQEHFAVVVDEYGDLTGVVTMEDVLETLLGMEIVDESDSIEDLRKMARERWNKRAARLGISLPEEITDTGTTDDLANHSA